MIGRLQRKFILAATVAIAIILTAIISMVNIYNYIRVTNQINSVLSLISEYGYLPETKDDGTPSEGDGSAEQPVSSSSSDSLFDNFELNQESYYQIRYYIAKYNADGELQSLDIDHIAALDETEAAQLAGRFLSMTEQNSVLFDRSTGRMQYGEYVYAYKCSPLPDKGTMLVVMDATSNIGTFRAFFSASFWFGILCIGIFIAIVSALSKRILRPMIQNMENQKAFITNAGHELKTPVAIISANAEVLEMMNGQSEWTDSILQQSKRLSLLINNLITLSRMSERDEPVQLADTDISLITRENAQSYRPVIEQQHKKCEIDIQPDVHALVEKDTYGELVNILVDNAAKYCDEDGMVTIKLDRETSKKGARLTVSNSYKDGKDVDYSRFFQRFYREDSSHNSKKAGYGIGLSMAEQIVELCRGKIRVNWKDGVISFVVTLR